MPDRGWKRQPELRAITLVTRVGAVLSAAGNGSIVCVLDATCDPTTNWMYWLLVVAEDRLNGLLRLPGVLCWRRFSGDVYRQGSRYIVSNVHSRKTAE